MKSINVSELKANLIEVLAAEANDTLEFWTHDERQASRPAIRY